MSVIFAAYRQLSLSVVVMSSPDCSPAWQLSPAFYSVSEQKASILF